MDAWWYIHLNSNLGEYLVYSHKMKGGREKGACISDCSGTFLPSLLFNVFSGSEFPKVYILLCELN